MQRQWGCCAYINQRYIREGLDLLDLTKERLNLIKDAQKEGESNDRMQFVFADVNCRPVVKMVSGEFISFKSLEEFRKI